MSSESDTPSARPVKQRSPNHPAFSLPKVLVRAVKLFEKARTAAVPIPVACSYLGVSPNSSTGMRWQSTLQEFGLVDAEGRGKGKTLQVSELGRILLKHPDRNSKEYKDALRAAALSPKTHRRVWEMRTDGHLPADAHLYFELSGPDWGFTEGAARAFVSQFRETIAFAGLTESDELEETEDDREDDSPPPSPAAQPPVPAPATPTTTDAHASWMPNSTPESKTIPIPLLSGGTAILQIPYPLDDQDCDWVTDLLGKLRRSMQRTEPPIAPSPTTGARGEKEDLE